MHRALDTTGAMLGPLVAFGLLALAPLAFDAVFTGQLLRRRWWAWRVLVLFVDDRAAAAAAAAAGGPRRAPSLRGGRTACSACPGFAPLLVVGSVLGLATLSDGFLYLALEQRVDFEPTVFPLLFVGTALVYMLLAVPGRAAGGPRRARAGVRRRLRAAARRLRRAARALRRAGGPCRSRSPCSGIYYAATDGVLMALGSALSPPDAARHLAGPARHGHERRAAAGVRDLRRPLGDGRHGERDPLLRRRLLVALRGRRRGPGARREAVARA